MYFLLLLFNLLLWGTKKKDDEKKTSTGCQNKTQNSLIFFALLFDVERRKEISRLKALNVTGEKKEKKSHCNVSINCKKKNVNGTE